MSPRSAVEIIHRRELVAAASAEDEALRLARRYADAHLSPQVARDLGVIDAVIEPSQTRARVVDALVRAPAAALPAADPAHGHVVWLTGLPASGKSSVAAVVARELRARGRQVEVLDGGAMRRTLSRGLGFSAEDRHENVRRIAFVAEALSRNGVCVVVTAISPYRAAREEARAILGDRFVEVHVRASLDDCARRDDRGRYARALRGELDGFTGVSDPYEPPPDPELVLDTVAESAEQCAARVLALVAPGWAPPVTAARA